MHAGGQQLWIVNPHTVKKQSHLPLRLRAEIIRRRFKLKGFDPVTLRQYYLRLGVKYRWPHYDYQQKHRKAEEIQGKQQQFTKELGTCMMEGERSSMLMKAPSISGSIRTDAG